MNEKDKLPPLQPKNERTLWDSLINYVPDKMAQRESNKIVKESERVPADTDDYKMDVNERLEEDKQTNAIRGAKWLKIYQRAWAKDDNVEKNESYRSKVNEAIKQWNALPKEVRDKFLETGEYGDGIDGDMVSLLTSARAINFAESQNKGKEEDDEEEEEEDDEEKNRIRLQQYWDGIFGWGRRHLKEALDSFRDEDEIQRVPHEYPYEDPYEDTDEDDEPGKTEYEPDDEEDELGDEEDDEKDGEQDEEEDDEKEDDEEDDESEDEPGDDDKSEDEFDVGHYLDLSGLNKVPKIEEEEKKRRFLYVLGNLFGRRTPKPPVPEDNTPEKGEKPEEPEYEIIKEVREEALPPEEQAESSEKNKKFLGALRRGALLGLLALTLIKPTHHEAFATAGNARVETTSTQTEYSLGEETRHIDDRTITEEVEVDKDSEKYRALALEKLMKETSLGDKVFVGEGTEYWESPDHEYGGADRHATIDNDWIRPEDYYTVDRLVVLDKETGKYLGNYYVGNGDTGTLQELVDKATENYEDEYSVHVHLNNPTTGWTDDILSGEIIKSDDKFVETKERVIPGFDYTVPVLNKSEVTTRSVGENVNFRSGAVTIVNEDGTVSTINVMHEDGSYYKAGESVVDSNGRVHTIQSIHISPETNTRSVSHKNVAWNLGMLGLAGTGLLIGALGKRKNEEAAEETGDTNANTAGAAPEVGKVRDMMELTAGQLVKLTDIFDKVAGERAPDIAGDMASHAEIEPSTPDEELPDNSILRGMNVSERTVARALLAKRDEATLKYLSDLLGITLDSYVENILAPDEKPVEEEAQDVEA